MATELEAPSSCPLRTSLALHHIPLVGPCFIFHISSFVMILN
jgi:hypothetical protein